MRSYVRMFADNHQFYKINEYVSTIQTKLQHSTPKQPVGISQIHLRAIKGNMDLC